MASQRSMRAELDALRAEVEALRAAKKPAAPEPAAAEPAGEKSLEDQLRQLAKLAEETLAEAEDTVADHPLASVAAALALGIVIGRLTAR
jgi:ElaB/YqjD/DUF883 family membrane-anchored ribosome-binding protein